MEIQSYILYEDRDLIVCRKPAGVPVQTKQIQTKDMVSLLKNYRYQQEGGKGEPYLGVIHRLDQPVEGIIVFAKTPQAAKELNRQLPGVGDHVTTPEGLHGEVQAVHVLRQIVKVIVTLDNDEKEIREYPAADLKFKPRRRKKDVKLSKQEMKELAALEKGEGASKLDDK